MRGPEGKKSTKNPLTLSRLSTDLPLLSHSPNLFVFLSKLMTQDPSSLMTWIVGPGRRCWIVSLLFLKGPRKTDSKVWKSWKRMPYLLSRLANRRLCQRNHIQSSFSNSNSSSITTRTAQNREIADTNLKGAT